jgi:hypothetical protein
MLLPLLAALAVSASPAEVASPPLVTAEGSATAAEARRGHPLVGLAVDAAFPDGAGVSLLLMPFDFLRLEAGGLTNGLGLGVRAGASLVAFPRYFLRPTLGAEGGYVWGGRAMWALGYVSDPTLRSALSDVNVSFITARVGLELGSKNFAFTVQGGVSYLDATIGSQTVDLGGGASLQASGSRVHGFVPSARVGFLFCFG